jgi:hypothetical protein
MFDKSTQLPAFDQLHAEITGTIAFSDFMNRNDERVIESRG